MNAVIISLKSSFWKSNHLLQNIFLALIIKNDCKTISYHRNCVGIAWWFFFFSVLARLQLGFPILHFLGFKKLVVIGLLREKIQPDTYYASITMHGTIMIFFVLTAGLSGTFANFLIPLQIGARDMASPFVNMLSYWAFFIASGIMFSSFCAWWTGSFWMDFLCSTERFGRNKCRQWERNGSLVAESHLFYFINPNGRYQLYFYHPQHAHQRNGDEQNAVKLLGTFVHCNYGLVIIPCVVGFFLFY